MDFREELARLDLLLHREILRLRAGYQLSLDEYRGLYISDEQVDALVARTPPMQPVEQLTAEADAMAARIGEDSPIGRLAGTLGLDRFERDVLLVAVAPELSLKYEALYAYLNNSSTRTQPTIDLALRLCGRGEAGERARLHAASRLFREAMLVLGEPAGRGWLGRCFAIAPALAAALQDLPIVDPRLADWVLPCEGPELLLAPSAQSALGEVAHALSGAVDPPIVLIESEAPQAAAAAVRHLFALLSRGTLRLEGNATSPDRARFASLALLARIRGDGVFLDAEDWTADARRLVPTLLSTLSAARVPIAVAASARTDILALARDLPFLRVRLNEPDPAERELLWRRAADRAGLVAGPMALEEVARHFRLGPAQIAAAVRTLAGTECSRDRLFAAARDQSSGQLAHLATRIPLRHAMADLVLPPVVLRRLREVLGAMRMRAKVFGDWGFGHRGGCGLMVLFAGSSGTGKTMSAQVLAREIGLELFRIDLASVVSKYIGETEKNLERIFDAARSANVILFFDEADALLGRRSEIKDAHDRYANIEVAYLLQKMEEHDGVVILASNLSKNMDQAFARRMHYVVDFPRPDAPLREQLWRRAFPSRVPMATDVDFAFLARQFDLAGGDIKTIALDAAFLAASQERAVAMTDLVGAVSRQMFKQGRPLGASDFKQYHVVVADGAAS